MLGEPQAKKQKVTRTTKKETLFAFVNTIDDDDDKNKICACGCIKDFQHLTYSAQNTSAVERHMKVHHRALFDEWKLCQDAKGDFKVVYEKRDKLFDQAASQIKKQQSYSNTLFKKVQSGLSNQILASLHLTIWAVCNAVSRLALNDPIFDHYHKLLGIYFLLKIIIIIIK